MNRISPLAMIASLRTLLWQFATLSALAWAIVLGLSLPMPASPLPWFYASVLTPLGMAALMAWREMVHARAMPRRRRGARRLPASPQKAPRSARAGIAHPPLRRPA